MFFKRLSRSRSRSNSQSYVDDYRSSPHDSKTNSQSYDDAKYDNKFDNKYQQGSPTDAQAPPSRSGSDRHSDALAKETGASMYNRQSGAPQEVQHGKYTSPPQSAGGQRGMTNGGYDFGGQPSPAVSKPETAPAHAPAPDLLMQAFNMALKPYTDKTEALETEIADLRAYIDQLEGQRSDIHAWIDKRGLRPDVPPSIAHQMDQTSHTTSPTHAAATLNAQLDRKITIVNFDLHRLQDDLNDSLPTPSFSACMLKFLPDINRLASLPSGPRYAFDLLLKLGGNLNSHGGLENGDEEDLNERRSFYARLDEAMVDVARGRFREEGDGWGVQREIKRIEKTGAYLRNWGVEPYFPRTLEAMREGSGVSQATGGAASPAAYQ